MHLVRKQSPWFPSLIEELFASEWNPQNAIFNQVPPVNIVENDADYQVSLAAPGKSKEDFEIAVEDGILSITAEEKEEKVVEKGKFTRKEFGFNAFQRSFTLPESVDPTKIDGRYAHGVLELTLPKYKEAQPQPRQLIAVK